MATHHSNTKLICNLCESNIDSHTMTVKYRVCTTTECHENNKECLFEIKTKQCSITQKNQIFSCNQHNSILAKKKNYGIPQSLRDYIINRYLAVDSSLTAMKIRSNLTQHKEEIERSNVELVDFHIPQLNKIQNLITYYRKTKGNNNIVDEVEKFVIENYVKPDELASISDDKSFVFGCKLNSKNQPIINIGILMIII